MCNSENLLKYQKGSKKITMGGCDQNFVFDMVHMY